MPYKSDAQRRFFHTDTAKKKGITEETVNEFDKASKGKKLPEKKMAFGGETNPKHETLSAMENNPSAGFADGGEIKEEKPFNGIKESDYGTLAGLRDMLRKAAEDKAPKASTDTVHMADGGDVSDALAQLAGNPFKTLTAPVQAGAQFVENNLPMASKVIGSSGIPGLSDAANAYNLMKSEPSMPQPVTTQGLPPPTPNMPVTPPAGPSPISMAAKNAETMQETPGNIYQGITADDRARVYQNLLAQKSSPGNMVASGAAGLGDAITRSFGGGQNNNFQTNLRENQEKNVQNVVGGMDTQRQQKMQDLQANIAVQESDPKSPYSVGMRQFLSQLTGKQFPSGISASMMKSFFADYAKIFDAQLQAATAGGQQGIEAGKELAGQGLWQRMVNKILPAENPGENYLEKRISGGGTPAVNKSTTASKTPGGYTYTVRR